MNTATYRYYVDWNNDGDFGDSYEDISAYVLNASWERGASSSNPLTDRDRAGSCKIILDNSDSRFSSFYTSSPLYGSILPSIRARVTMQIGAGAEITEWQGFLDSIIPKVGAVVGISTAELAALGPLAHPMFQQLVSVPMQTNIKTGAAINYILDAIGWPAGDRLIDTGQSTMSRWWISGKVTALQAILDIIDTETGRLRESKDGKIVFEDRAHRLNPPHTVSQATYGSGDPGDLFIWKPKQKDALRDIYNYIETQVRTFDQSEDIVLWTLAGNPPSIAPGATLTIVASIYSPGTPNNYIAVKEWTTVDYWANSQADGEGTDLTEYIDPTTYKTDTEVIIELENTGGTTAYITLCRCHGIAIVESDPVKVFSEDATSQSQFGLLKYPIPGKFFTDIDEAQDRGDHLLALFKDPRPKITFDLKANYGSDHLAEAQTRDLSDRITITAGVPYGLYVDEDFFVEWERHTVDSANIHILKMLCVSAVTHSWPASAPTYTPKKKPTSGNKVPDDLFTESHPICTDVRVGVGARKWNATIYQAELRAKFMPSGQTAEYVDLRTVDEGGTFSHNGTTQIILTGQGANWQGYTTLIDSVGDGRWYFAGRLLNLYGWSVWSDGNDFPEYVTDYVDTELSCDTGPPADWTVALVEAVNGDAIIRVTRPATNGNRLLFIHGQIKDASSYGFVPVNDDSSPPGPAQIKYDGSAIAHSYNKTTGIINKASGDWDDAEVGDLICLDRRGSTFDIKHCFWATVVGISGSTLTGLYHFEPDVTTDLRLQIVKPPWAWNTYGHFGDEAGRGYTGLELWQGGGDTQTQVFDLPPIPVPSGVNFTDLKARVWFSNVYSFSDDDEYSDFPESGTESQGCIPLSIVSGEVDTNLALGRVFCINASENFTLNKPHNIPYGGCPVVYMIKQTNGGNHTITLGSGIVLGDSPDDVTLSTAVGAMDLLGLIYFAADDYFSVADFRKNYTAPS